LSDDFRNSDWYAFNMNADRGDIGTMDVSELDDFEDL